MDILHYIPHALGVAATGVIGYFGKRYIENLLDRFEAAFEDVEEIKTNHLVHLQESVDQSNQTLQRLEVSHAEANGYLKRIAEK